MLITITNQRYYFKFQFLNGPTNSSLFTIMMASCVGARGPGFLYQHYILDYDKSSYLLYFDIWELYYIHAVSLLLVVYFYILITGISSRHFASWYWMIEFTLVQEPTNPHLLHILNQGQVNQEQDLDSFGTLGHIYLLRNSYWSISMELPLAFDIL